ncbi:MAG: hypothetical protein LWW92_05375 [Rhodocyclales bacterium]|nr:hypothetical protein [Rhodocyclales bacterium]
MSMLNTLLTRSALLLALASPFAQAATCTSDSQCPKNQFCDTGHRCPDGKTIPGQCAPKPEMCTQDFAPVKACNGKTYSNRCAAAAAGQVVVSPK